MSITQCKHIRIRGSYDNSVDVEHFIRSLELKYNIDIRSVAKWRDLVKSLYDMRNDMKSKIKSASARKKSIIEKLCIQNYRPSPFVLTDELARTAKVWEEIELMNRKKRMVDIKETAETIISYKCKNYKSQEFGGEDEMSEDEQLTVHPNTEVLESKGTSQPNFDEDVKSESSQKLPVNICTNPHKIISPVGSHCTPLSYHSVNTLNRHQYEPTVIKELDQTKSIRCHPKEIKVFDENEQPIKFFLTNCTNEYAFVRFKELVNDSCLRKCKLSPVTPIKLCAGLSKLYCLNYKLMPHTKTFEGILNFKIGKVSYTTFEEMLSIRFSCDFTEKRSVHVSETVTMQPVYPWQLSNKSYPVENIIIHVNDDFFYHLHVTKHDVQWSKLLGDESVNSLDVVSPNSESMMQRNDDAELESEFCTSSKFENQQMPDEAAETMDYISDFLNDILNISLESFYLKSTYAYLHPHSVKKIPVFLRKAEHVGPHQCYYNFEFYNPHDESIVINKTINILAEVLPHPIQIHPIILDMTENSIKQGMCVNYFTITNTHIFIPVTIKIKLTTKMRKLFKIAPMETLIPAQSEVPFEVWCCPRSVINPDEKCEESVHFTIKIIIIGDKAVYENVPPIFYEIIIPCAAEFKRVYGKKYFSDSPTLSQEPLPITSVMDNRIITKVV